MRSTMTCLCPTKKLYADAFYHVFTIPMARVCVSLCVFTLVTNDHAVARLDKRDVCMYVLCVCVRACVCMCVHVFVSCVRASHQQGDSLYGR